MDLFNTYDNEDSESSSNSDDEPKIKTENPSPKIKFATENPTTSSICCGFDPLGKVPIDRLMDATAKLAAEKLKKRREETLTPALKNLCLGIDKEIRMYLGSIQVLQKHTILSSMDRFISKFTKEYSKFNNPGIADFFANYIRSCMYIFKYLLRSHELGKRYYERVTRILGIYTDLELFAALRGGEYDSKVADRLALIYQTYLDATDNLLVLDVLLHSKRLCRLHRGILVRIFEHFMIPKTANEHPDITFMKYLYLYKKWIYIEEVDYKKIRDAFIKFIKPRKTLCMNFLFKAYLPVDGEGFVTVDNIDDVLDMEYSLTKLAHCIRKSVELATSSATGQVGDDEPGPESKTEPDYDSFSNPGTSSMASSHQHDMSSDSDSQSVSSIYGIRLSTSQKIMETVSVDSLSSLRKSSSDSFGNFDWKMDEASTTIEAKSDEAKSDDAKQNEEHTISMETAINDKAKPKLNGDTSENVSTSDDLSFIRRVNDINSTHLSLPSNGSISSDVDVMQNGNQSQNDEDDNEQNKIEASGHNILSNNAKNQMPVVCDVLDNFNNGTVDSITEVHPIVNGETELIDDERPNQHVNADEKPNEKPNENCDNEVILTEDLKEPSAIPPGSGSQKTFVDTACSPLIFEDKEKRKKENEIEIKLVVKEPAVESIVDNPSVNEPIDKAYNEIVVEDTCELVDTPTSDLKEEHSKEPLTILSDDFEELVERRVVLDAVGTTSEPPNRTAISYDLPIIIIDDPPFVIDAIEAVGKEPRDWVPAAESTVSVLSETSLLTKSEQDILFKDRESVEIFSELFTHGPSPIKVVVEKPSEDTLSQISSDSPLTILVNGLDPNHKLKTYCRKDRKPKIDTKIIPTQTTSTQTCSSPQAARVSPVITIDDSIKTDKEFLTDDDEQFLSDIFNSTDPQVDTGNISKVRRTKTYLALMPASKPLRTYAVKRPATQLTSPVSSTTPKTDGIVNAIKPIEKSIEDSRKFGMIEPSLLTASIKNQENATETPPGVVKRKRGRPRKYPLLTPATADIYRPAVELPRNEPKKRGRKPKPKDPLPLPSYTSESIVEPKVLRPRRIKAKRISHFQDVLKIKSPTLRRLTISRRFSKVFSLADTPKLATILRRITYNKPINTSRSFTNKNYDSTLSSSGILYSSAYRLNGQKNANDSPATNKTTTIQTNEPKERNDSSMLLTLSNSITSPTKPSRPTILERKNYLKSNQTSSPMAPALKFSPHSAKYNHDSPQRIRHINRIQRYSRIDSVMNHILRRERKKSVENTNPLVHVKRIDLNSFRNLNVSEIPRSLVENAIETTNATGVNTNDVQNSTALVVDLTDDDEMQWPLFGPSMNSIQETSYFTSMHSNKRRHSRSNDTETDMTNEFTTDQEWNVEDSDDSTRKSKRSRKRPTILDL